MTKPPSHRPTPAPPSSMTPPSETDDLAPMEDRLKCFGGSRSDQWNFTVIQQVIDTLWLTNSDPEARGRLTDAALIGLAGIAPRGEIEGMMAAQLLAAHHATMECFRRAMVPGQTIESRQGNLTQANKLARTWAMLLDALNKHRGKGQQKVIVEHVHVHAGGQAVVGSVEAPTRSIRSDPVAPTLPGGGVHPEPEDQPHARSIEHHAHALQPSLRRHDQEQDAVSIASDGERPLPDARRLLPRRP